MLTNSEKAPARPVWLEVLPCAPVNRNPLGPIVLPVWTWKAERGICMACKHLDYSGDPAMVCVAGPGAAKRIYSCIDMRSTDGGCGPELKLFEAKRIDFQVEAP